MTFGAALGRHLGTGADRAGDGDQAGGLVLDEHPAGVAVAGDDVEGARREELGGDLGQRRVVSGVVSLGLSTMVLPAARAGAIFHTAIISG